MNDFDYDVMQMKRLAGQAKYRKRGSKSRKCPMSTDGMTRKQWEKRCGEVMTYQMMAPVTWDMFRNYPASIKREYISGLIQKFSVTATDLAEMFGVTPATVLKICSGEDVGVMFHRGKRMNAEQRDAFNKFLKCEQDKDVRQTEELNLEAADIVERGEKSANMSMSAFSLIFDGEFDREMVYNSMAFMLPLGTNVRLEVRCEILG